MYSRISSSVTFPFVTFPSRVLFTVVFSIFKTSLTFSHITTLSRYHIRFTSLFLIAILKHLLTSFHFHKFIYIITFLLSGVDCCILLLMFIYSLLKYCVYTSGSLVSILTCVYCVLDLSE